MFVMLCAVIRSERLRPPNPTLRHGGSHVLRFVVRLIAVIAALTSIPARATPVPSESDHVRALDGTWRFKIEQLGVRSGPRKVNAPIPPIVTPKEPESFEKLDYKEDASWHDLKVPGNWEMAGYTP